MDWKHTLFNNRPIGLEFDANLGGTFRSCTFTKWWLTILSTRFRDLPKDWTVWLATMIIWLIRGTKVVLLLSSSYFYWSLVLPSLPSSSDKLVSLPFFTLSFLVEDIIAVTVSFAAASSLKNFTLTKYHLDGKWFNITIHLPFPFLILFKTLVQGWRYRSMFV